MRSLEKRGARRMLGERKRLTCQLVNRLSSRAVSAYPHASDRAAMLVLRDVAQCLQTPREGSQSWARLRRKQQQVFVTNSTFACRHSQFLASAFVDYASGRFTHVRPQRDGPQRHSRKDEASLF